MSDHAKTRGALLFGLGETGVSDYRSEADRLFLEALQGHFDANGWAGDGWSMFTDRVVITLTCKEPGSTTFRIDFFGSKVAMGLDPAHQLADDIDPVDPATCVVEGKPVSELASRAAEWLAVQLRNRKVGAS